MSAPTTSASEMARMKARLKATWMSGDFDKIALFSTPSSTSSNLFTNSARNARASRNLWERVFQASSGLAPVVEPL